MRLEKMLAPYRLIAVSVFVFMISLYFFQARALLAVIYGVVGVIPWRSPFLDTDTVLSAIRCGRLGIDVFARNPCDDLGRVFDYSPLWLVGDALPMTRAWIAPIGMMVDIGFMIALLVLPVPSDRRSQTFMAFSAVSSGTFYLLERGNNDAVIFALIVFGALLIIRGGWASAAGGALIVLAGLLKYYPMLACAAFLRQRFRTFIVLSVMTIVMVGAFLGGFGHQLIRAIALIPTGSYFGTLFGASTLPGGTLEILSGSASLIRPVEAVLLILAAILAFRLARSTSLPVDIEQLSPPRRLLLLMGALVILAFWLTAQNIGYRVSLLLLVLPGLLALSAAKPKARLYRVATMFTVMLMWSEGFIHTATNLAPLSATVNLNTWIFIGVWLILQVLWWTMAVTLLAVVIVELRRPPALIAVLAWLRKSKAGGGGA